MCLMTYVTDLAEIALFWNMFALVTPQIAYNNMIVWYSDDFAFGKHMQIM